MKTALLFMTSLLVGSSIFFSANTNAHTAAVQGKVNRILVTQDSFYGGCMVQLNFDIAATGLNCPPGWLSMGCSGDIVTPTEASRMLEAAQMSLALNRAVYGVVDDTKKHNGYCTLIRIDNL